MKAAAISKAESLAQYVRHSGSPPSEFQLAITVGEAYELLDHLAQSEPANALLVADIATARIDADPWRVLAHYRLNGFELVPVSVLH